MKKILLLIFITGYNLMAFSQAAIMNTPLPANDEPVNLFHAQPPNSPPTINAVFDLQFDYVLPRGGFAGITWTASEFWVSKWQSDSVFLVDDSTGALLSYFFIPGVTGIRGMTYDGTHVWVSNNSDTIYAVDTMTKAVVDTIIAPMNVRGITYDSSANGGAGGFWIANYATDIVQIDLSGGTLNSILAGTHGLTSMYGIAFDPWSTGGPYIWAFDQGTTGTMQNLVRISIATGIKDVVHNVGLEIGGTGISGGLSITGFANPGPHTFLGVSQDSPGRVFGLELADYTPPLFDASSDTLIFTPAFTLTPAFLTAPINWELSASNHGTSQLDTLFVDLTVNDGVSNVFTDSNFETAVAPLTSVSIPLLNTFIIPTAVSGSTYTATTITNTGIQTDQVNNNDTLSYSFSISDTTLLRNGAANGSIGIGTGTGGSIGLLFELPITTYATSATFSLRRPTLGDSIRAELYDWSGTAPNNLIASSAAYIITAADTGGAVLTLPYLNAPYQLSPGTYIACIHEYNNNVSINYGFFNWRPNTSWVFIAANGWRAAESYNYKMVPFIGLNVWSQQMVSVEETGANVFSLFPNPASSQFSIEIPVAGDYELTVSDYQGKIVYQRQLQGLHRETIVATSWSSGLYLAQAIINGRNYSARIVISH